MGWHGALTADTEWSGEVLVDGDLLIPQGKLLRIHAGTKVRFAPKPAWSCAVFRSAPEGWPIETTRRELCDIVVQGRLEILGAVGASISLGTPEEPWGGLCFLGQGRGRLRQVRIAGARETSLQALDDARIDCVGCLMRDSEKGLWAMGLARVRFISGEIAAERWGAICCEGAQVRLERSLLRGGEQGCSASGWALVELAGCRFEGQVESAVCALDHGWVRMTDCVSSIPPTRLNQARIDALNASTL